MAMGDEEMGEEEEEEEDEDSLNAEIEEALNAEFEACSTCTCTVYEYNTRYSYS